VFTGRVHAVYGALV